MAITATVRTMKKADLDDIVDIDAKVLGTKRREYWEAKFLAMQKFPTFSLVADVNGKVVGFIMGEASGWEYGVPTSIAWIDTVGINPEFQKKGIGRLLIQEILANFRKVGVEKVYTMVNWRDRQILHFFSSVGFAHGDMINLELRL